MKMKQINSAKLRAIGYEARKRLLQVQLDHGTTLQFSSVGDEVWRRFSSSGAAWSFYRDNIKERFPTGVFRLRRRLTPVRSMRCLGRSSRVLRSA